MSEREEFKKAVEKAAERTVCEAGLCAEGSALCVEGSCAAGEATCVSGMHAQREGPHGYSSSSSGAPSSRA